MLIPTKFLLTLFLDSVFFESLKVCRKKVMGFVVEAHPYQ